MLSLAIVTVVGCSSDAGFSTSDSDIPSGTCGALTQQLGAGVGASFVAGALSVGLSPLSAGGSTSVTVNVVDCANNPYTTPVSVSFSSTCTGLSTAQIESPITTNNGTAITTYVAQGCQGNDIITATAVIENTDLTATGVVNVLSAAAGSIEFVSATPELISLKGTGGAGLTENSTVVFKVSDVSGGPVSNLAVTFSLNTTIGGLSLSTSSGTTNADGQVQTVVQAGTVPTAVRVTATVSGTTPVIATQSDQLVVSTGIPDQNSFSLSADKFTPEAWDYDGVVVAITARLADRFNNPVPDGTVITFTSEGGSIGSSCSTVDGACSVDWISQAPRPCGQELGELTLQANPVLNSCIVLDGVTANPSIPQTNPLGLGQPYGGRVTIIATAVGEESFVDNNSNGVFDNGDVHQDIAGEAYLDINEDGDRDLNQDIYFDFDVDGSYDGSGDGLFNGVLCQHPTLCSDQQTLHVRGVLVLTMSGSAANIDVSPNPISFPNGGSTTADLTISDLHNLPLPGGTRVEVSTTYGTITSSSSFLIPDSNGYSALFYGNGIAIKGTGTAGSGTLNIKITTPRGLITNYSVPVTGT